jgi:hypothetical protein
MVFAAAGLSAETDNDPCSDFQIEGSGSGSAYQYWPPGVTCSYSLPDGRTVITHQAGHPTAFFAILAAGLLLVLVRRSKLAIATALMFGAAGLGGFYMGFVQIPFAAFWIGLPLTLLATRSLPATAIASAALAVGWCAQFSDVVPAVYAIVLLLLILIPQRAEVPVSDARSH